MSLTGLEKTLRENGLGEDDEFNKDNLVKAIAATIHKNNLEISKKVPDFNKVIRRL